MKRILGIVLAVACAAAALPATADEYDFVGYRYSDDYKRDYDRGFFFGAEAWYVNTRDLHYEPAISGFGPGSVEGGRLLDLDHDFDVSGRYFLGYRANRRVGTFTLSYWDYDEDEVRQERAGWFLATMTHPSRGEVLTDAFNASTETDVEFAELQWQKDFGQGRKFSGWWSVSLNWYQIEQSNGSYHFNELLPGADGVLVESVSDNEAFGGRVGIGGRYQFSDRVSMGAGVKVGFASSEVDYAYADQQISPGFEYWVAYLERQHTEGTSLSLEGDVNFRWRVAGGFELDWGYRYLTFDDAVARDVFMNSGNGAATSEGLRDLSFEGPYLGFRYVAGVAKIDSDGDGVLDVYDDCPDTPAGAWVDEKGCPRDLDEDGVHDGIDRCPGTQFGTRVDEWGCGIDSDSDGVFDGLDLCPNTPGCAHVDGRGCPKDSDGDGVADGCDACPATPAGQSVDAAGCTIDLDSDGDTVPDSRDKCPGTARGATVDENGCEQVVQMMLHFDTDSAKIRDEDKPLLDRIAAALRADGGSFEVAGHADARNTVEYNQALSERRAASVKDYLVAHGVDASNLVSVGYSELRPIASNDTERGMALNRRVEIVRR